MFAKNARRYLALTLGYGFTRAVTWDYNGKKEYYNREKFAYEEKEMLITDKIGRITCNTWAAVTVGMQLQEFTAVGAWFCKATRG